MRVSEISNMYYFYVLYSLKDHRLYKGASNNLPRRVLQHDAGMVKSTRYRRPLILLYFEGYAEKEKAFARERWSKTLEGGPGLKALLKEKGLLNERDELNVRLG